MKRWLLCLLSVLLLAGCGTEPPLTGDEVTLAYFAAEEVYNWFNLCSLPTAGEAVEADGRSYRPVEDEALKTYADLEARVRGCFAPELAEEILSDGGNYRDIDGRLYCAEGARGGNLSLKERTVSATRTGDDLWTVTVTFWADSYGWEQPAASIGYSQTALHYAKTAQGWRFTDFCPSDALDETADMVFSFTYDFDTWEATDFTAYSDLQLALYTLHADGAFAESSIGALYPRFLARPGELTALLASLLPDWQAQLCDSIASAAANGWREERTGFQAALDGLSPTGPAEQAVAARLREAFEAALAGAEQLPVETEFSLIVPGEKRVLTLGPQEGEFPWGYTLEGALLDAYALEDAVVGRDGVSYQAVCEMDCGGLILSYLTAPDGACYLRLIADGSAPSDSDFSTGRGVACGCDEEALRRYYPGAVQQADVPTEAYDALYVYAPDDTDGRQISFFCKDGAVALIEIADSLHS